MLYAHNTQDNQAAMLKRILISKTQFILFFLYIFQEVIKIFINSGLFCEIKGQTFASTKSFADDCFIK